MAELRIALLGPARVEVDGAPIQVDTRKAVALLAYLAVTGDRQGRDAVAGLLWPDYDQDHARAALRRTLSALGKALGGGWLAADRTSLGLDTGGLWLDVGRFADLLAACGGHGHPVEQVCQACLEPLAEAAALHRGDFMAGFTLRDADPFDDWRFFEAERLRRELAGVLERLVAGLAAAGRHQAAIEAGGRWLALDPLHEPAHRQLMRLYAWSGQRAAASRQYRACVRVLDEELGVAPLEDTTALYQAIVEGDLPAAAVLAAPVPAAVAPAPPDRPARPELPLVGRAGEWAALLGAYQAAAQGGRLVVLEGEAGIGKTRLGEDLLDHARRRGAATVAARCYQEEHGLAYAPFADGLRAALGPGQAGGAWVGKLPGHSAREAARLLPELDALRPDLGPPPPDGPGAQRRLLEGLTQTLLAALAGPAPGVLFLDDLHWADEASLDLLTYLVRRLARRPLCVAVTWRDEQVGREHRLRRLAGEAERAGIATVLRPARLGPGDVAELVRTAVPERAASAPDLYRETEGLPFFVAEYLAVMAGGTAAGRGAVPGGVRELLLARLASVGETSRQLLATAAVLGRSFDFDTVREASGRSDEEAVAGLEELVAAGLVREVAGAGRGGAAYDFGHEKLRALAYQETSLARRRLLHRRAAEALAARPARAARDAGAIGHHFQLGGADDRAAAWFALAGEHAHALHANREALGHLQAALALGHPDTAGLHAAIGDLEVLLGEYDAALASYEAAAARAGPGELAACEQKLGGLHHRRGDWPAADAHYEAALAALGDGPGSRAGRARVLADRSLTAHHRQQPERAMALATEALTLAEAAGDTRALAQAHNILGVLAASLGDRTAARRHLEGSLALAEGLPDPGAKVAALNNLALAVGAGGDLDDAVQLAGQALRRCVAQGDRHREAALHNNLADLLHAAGRHDAAMDHLKRAVAIFAEVGEPGRLEPEIWKLVEW